jgi:hypothetical protein
MQNNESGNSTSNNQNRENRDYAPEDWREARREWRRERREARCRSPFHGLFPGLVLILIGALFLGNMQGWIGWENWWEYFVIGLGSIFIITGLINLSTPYYRYNSYGRFIPGGALIAAGLISLLGFTQWWPVVLIAAGAIILAIVILRPRSNCS